MMMVVPTWSSRTIIGIIITIIEDIIDSVQSSACPDTQSNSFLCA